MALYNSPLAPSKPWNDPTDNIVVTRLKPDGYSSFFQPFDKYYVNNLAKVYLSAKFGGDRPLQNGLDRQYNEFGNMHSAVKQAQRIFNSGIDAKYEDDNDPSQIFTEDAQLAEQNQQIDRESVLRNIDNAIKMYELELRSFRKDGGSLSEKDIQDLLAARKKQLFDSLATEYSQGLSAGDENELSKRVAMAKGGGVPIAPVVFEAKEQEVNPMPSTGSERQDQYNEIIKKLKDAGMAVTQDVVQHYWIILNKSKDELTEEDLDDLDKLNQLGQNDIADMAKELRELRATQAQPPRPSIYIEDVAGSEEKKNNPLDELSNDEKELIAKAELRESRLAEFKDQNLTDNKSNEALLKAELTDFNSYLGYKLKINKYPTTEEYKQIVDAANNNGLPLTNNNMANYWKVMLEQNERYDPLFDLAPGAPIKVEQKPEYKIEELKPVPLVFEEEGEGEEKVEGEEEEDAVTDKEKKNSVILKTTFRVEKPGTKGIKIKQLTDSEAVDIIRLFKATDPLIRQVVHDIDKYLEQLKPKVTLDDLAGYNSTRAVQLMKRLKGTLTFRNGVVPVDVGSKLETLLNTIKDQYIKSPQYDNYGTLTTKDPIITRRIQPNSVFNIADVLYGLHKYAKKTIKYTKTKYDILQNPKTAGRKPKVVEGKKPKTGKPKN